MSTGSDVIEPFDRVFRSLRTHTCYVLSCYAVHVSKMTEKEKTFNDILKRFNINRI